MSILLGLFGSSAGRKVAIYGGIALAVLLMVFGIYRAGGKAAENAARARTIDRTVKVLKTRERDRK